MNILVADDNKIVRYGLNILLKNIWSNCVIFEADNLDMAISVISENNINLMVFDVNIPKSEKLQEVIRFVIKEAKVVVFSSNDMNIPVIESLLDAGTDMFFFKDSTIDEIKIGLTSLFGKIEN